MSKQSTKYRNWWPCACVKRDATGNMTHMKVHKPTKKRCQECKCERPEPEEPPHE